MGYIHLNPSDIDEFLIDIQKIISNTKAEKGCFFYSVTVDDVTAGRMLVAERWQDQESLVEHLERQEMEGFLNKWETRIKSDILKYDALNARSLME
jgi:quinol monooxygenase YgiN